MGVKENIELLEVCLSSGISEYGRARSLRNLLWNEKASPRYIPTDEEARKLGLNPGENALAYAVRTKNIPLIKDILEYAEHQESLTEEEIKIFQEEIQAIDKIENEIAKNLRRKERSDYLNIIFTAILSKLTYLGQSKLLNPPGGSQRKMPITEMTFIRNFFLSLSSEDFDLFYKTLKKDHKIDLLLYSVVNGDLELLKHLHKLKVDLQETYPNFTKLHGDRFYKIYRSSLIHIALSNREPEIAKFLIDHTAMVDIDDYNGNTPLVFAVYEHYTDLVSLLLQRSANPLSQDREGFTPLDLARKYRFTDVVQALEKDPKQIEIEKVDPNIQATQIIRRAGHALGIGDLISVSYPKNTRQLKVTTESSYSLNSTVQLKEILTEYQPLPSLSPALQEIFHVIQEATTVAAQFLTCNGSITTSDLLKRYQSNEMVSIPTGWTGHGITVVLYKDYLILSNRGEGRGETGTLLYKIPHRELINEKFMRNLSPSGNFITKDDILNTIYSVVDQDKPIVKFPTKEQKRGTCTFVNQKSAVMGMIYLLLLEKLEQKLKSSAKEDRPLVNLAIVKRNQNCSYPLWKF